MTSWEALEAEALSDSSAHRDKCKFGQWVESLGDNSKYVDSAIDNTQISNRALYRALTARGLKCGVTTLDNHRTHNCKCFKDNS